MRSRSGFAEGFLYFIFHIFSFVVCIVSFLIQSSYFIRFNVVVVISHDDIEMWTTSCTTRLTWPSDWNSKRLSLRTSIEREETSRSDQSEETAVKPK